VNVLMLLFGPVGKGTYWRALHLARSLSARGHTFTLLATARGRRLGFRARPDQLPAVTIVEAPDIIGGPLRYGWDPWNALARLAWIRRRHFDLVHGFESRPTVILPALCAQRRRGIPLVLDWCDWFGRGGSVEERPNRLVRALFRPLETVFEEHFRADADGTTVINTTLYRRAIQLGVAPDRILRLPNGCDVEGLRPIPKAEARRALGWASDLPVIGYVGAIFQRDAVLMARAFDRIRQTEHKAELLLAGYCNVAVEELVQAPAAVRRTGHLTYEQINLHLAACDVCWLPLCDSGANRGRYPLKVNDYMAIGRPVVATAVGDVADLIRRGGFGLLATDQPGALAEKVLTLLHDPAQREIMGRRARRLAETEMTWDQMSHHLERFYAQVLEERWS
jgi:glycosyltransferase involved in cell wall biosynthesis